MDTKIDHPFKFFTYSSSLFELIEKHFPFTKHVQYFNERYAQDPHEVFIDEEIYQIDNRYADNKDDPSCFGFHTKIRNEDYDVLTLLVDFEMWIPYKERNLNALNEIYKMNGLTGQCDNVTTVEDLERTYFEELAAGVNDAKLKRYLVDLKSKLRFERKGILTLSQCVTYPIYETIIEKTLIEMGVLAITGQPAVLQGKAAVYSATLDAILKYKQVRILKQSITRPKLQKAIDLKYRMNYAPLKKGQKEYNKYLIQAGTVLDTLLLNKK